MMGMMDRLLGDSHAAFVRWCKSQGIEIHGVAPAGIPGRGMGMIATRGISVRSTTFCPVAFTQ